MSKLFTLCLIFCAVLLTATAKPYGGSDTSARDESESEESVERKGDESKENSESVELTQVHRKHEQAKVDEHKSSEESHEADEEGSTEHEITKRDEESTGYVNHRPPIEALENEGSVSSQQSKSEERGEEDDSVQSHPLGATQEQSKTNSQEK